ncbi:MAG: archease [Pseudomonadota bacterium]|nr:archease [Pseudomonadota bacterium]
MRLPSHSFEDHTADVRLHVEAHDLGALLEEAGRALGELMGGGAEGPLGDPLHVRVQAADRAALLVRWLDELVGLSEIEHRVWTDIHVSRVDERSVDAVVRGPLVEALRTAVKAATFHDLRVEEDCEGLQASVILDV